MSEPRNDADAERIVLGSLLITPRVFDEVLATGLTVGDFYQPAHELVFGAVLAANRAMEPHDAPALALRLAGDMRRVGGAAYLHELIACVPTVANAPFMAAKVVSLARLRKAQEVAASWAETADKANVDDVDEVIETMRAAFDERTASRTTTKTASFADLLATAMDRWETTDKTVLPTGWHDLDECLNGGLRPGHLCVIGARPAVGKSLAASVLAAVAAGRGIGTLFVSLEMPAAEVVDRVAANVAGIDLGRLTRHELTELDWQRASKFVGHADTWPLWVDDRAANTVSGIRSRARDLTRTKTGLGLIVVDYLQLVRSHDRRLSREQAVSEVTKGLRNVGREFAVPVVALAQVNRDSTKGINQRPAMSQLRESGAIEADADEVILLHRDDQEVGEIEFHVEKNRHGRTGRVVLAWSPHHARIASMARNFGAAS